MLLVQMLVAKPFLQKFQQVQDVCLRGPEPKEGLRQGTGSLSLTAPLGSSLLARKRLADV